MKITIIAKSNIGRTRVSRGTPEILEMAMKAPYNKAIKIYEPKDAKKLYLALYKSAWYKKLDLKVERFGDKIIYITKVYKHRVSVLGKEENVTNVKTEGPEVSKV